MDLETAAERAVRGSRETKEGTIKLPEQNDRERERPRISGSAPDLRIIEDKRRTAEKIGGGKERRKEAGKARQRRQRRHIRLRVQLRLSYPAR